MATICALRITFPDVFARPLHWMLPEYSFSAAAKNSRFHSALPTLLIRLFAGGIFVSPSFRATNTLPVEAEQYYL
ncbi:MAG: hypothetical protein WCE68_18045 [Anaerolineales bacterium]